MNYNYFVDYRIVTSDHEIDLNINPAYIPFTAEQNEFYIEHPNASYWEIRNCRMNPEPVPPTLEEVKHNCIKILSEKSLEILGRYVKEYQLANAQSSLYILEKYPQYNPIYTEDKAIEVITTYDRVGLDLRTIFKYAEKEINDCETSEEVENIKNYYMQQYDNYEYVYGN